MINDRMSGGELPEYTMPQELLELREDALAVGAAAATPDVFTDSWITGFDRAFARDLGERGWLGMTWPKMYGGHEAAPLTRFVVVEALIESRAPIASTWIGDRQIGPALLAFGTEQQRRRYLPELARGSTTWCLGMSESDSGSDLAHVSTRAIRDGSSYVVNGRKIWTSLAAEADYLYLICRTDPKAPAHLGLSELIVDLATPGIEISPVRDMSGGSHFNEVVFEDVRVPAENLVGEPHGSWRQTVRQLDLERGGIDRLLGTRKLYVDALRRADLTDPLIRQEIARIETGYRIGRLLVLQSLSGRQPAGSAALSKILGAELQQRVAQFTFRVAGSSGMQWEGRSRAACFAPAYTVMGGTSNILRNVIGERLLSMPREPTP